MIPVSLCVERDYRATAYAYKIELVKPDGYVDQTVQISNLFSCIVSCLHLPAWQRSHMAALRPGWRRCEDSGRRPHGCFASLSRRGQWLDLRVQQSWEGLEASRT